MLGFTGGGGVGGGASECGWPAGIQVTEMRSQHRFAGHRCLEGVPPKQTVGSEGSPARPEVGLVPGGRVGAHGTCRRLDVGTRERGLGSDHSGSGPDNWADSGGASGSGNDWEGGWESGSVGGRMPPLGPEGSVPRLWPAPSLVQWCWGDGGICRATGVSRKGSGPEGVNVPPVPRPPNPQVSRPEGPLLVLGFKQQPNEK